MQGTILGATKVDMIPGSFQVGSILIQTRANLGKATITQQHSCTLGLGPTAPSPTPLCRGFGSSCVLNEDYCNNACSGLAKVCNSSDKKLRSYSTSDLATTSESVIWIHPESNYSLERESISSYHLAKFRSDMEANPTSGIPGLHLRVWLGHRRDAKELVTA
jgi:hypothetical protein